LWHIADVDLCGYSQPPERLHVVSPDLESPFSLLEKLVALVDGD
jgi:hypothetical protein